MALFGLAVALAPALSASSAPSPGNDPVLLAYWNFNQSTAGSGGGLGTLDSFDEDANGFPADFGTGLLTTNFTINTVAGTTSENDGDLGTFGGSTLNAQFGDPADGALSVRGQDNNDRWIQFVLDTSGFEGIALSFAGRGTGTGFGSDDEPNTVSISTDGETFTPVTTYTSRQTSFQLYEFDFDGVADDQNGVIVRITFDGATSAGGNNRIDNVTVFGTPLDVTPTEPSNVQIVHNAPDPAAAAVDIYVNGDLFEANFAFRSATPFFPLDAGDYQITITLAGDASAVIYDETLSVPGGLDLQLVASGVANPNDFPANPEGISTAFDLIVNTNTASFGPLSAVAFSAFHGAPDAPTVSIAVRDTPLALGPFSYLEGAGPTSVPSRLVRFDILAGDEVLIGYRVDLSGTEGTAVTVFGSGFLAGLTDDDLESFAVLAVFADGTTTLLTPSVSIATARTLPLGTTVELEGTVGRARGAFTYMQDGSGANDRGIAIRQTSGDFREAVDAGTITEGTELRVLGITSQFRGLFQINQASATNNELLAFEVLGQGDGPMPIEATLAEIAADGDFYESRVVRVDDLAFEATGTFAAGTNYVVSDGSEGDVVFRIPNASDTGLVGTAIPELARFTGVVGQFTTATPALDGYQLLGIETTDVEMTSSADAEASPVVFDLVQNYPNPFARNTTVEFSLPQSSPVTLDVFDVAGRRVATLVDRDMEAGVHRVTWEADGLASGTYLYRIQAGTFTRTLRAQVIR